MLFCGNWCFNSICPADSRLFLDLLRLLFVASANMVCSSKRIPSYSRPCHITVGLSFESFCWLSVGLYPRNWSVSSQFFLPLYAYRRAYCICGLAIYHSAVDSSKEYLTELDFLLFAAGSVPTDACCRTKAKYLSSVWTVFHLTFFSVQLFFPIKLWNINLILIMSLKSHE